MRKYTEREREEFAARLVVERQRLEKAAEAKNQAAAALERLTDAHRKIGSSYSRRAASAAREALADAGREYFEQVLRVASLEQVVAGPPR